MRKALVVGINKYPAAPLYACINDAVAFANTMKRNGDGSPNFKVKLATDVPTKGKLKTLITELFDGDNDIALFYFSGHGYLDHIGGYLVTPDHEANDLGVSMDEILTIANASKTKNKVIILDCCHSGAFGSPKVAGGAAAQIIEGVTILTASKSDQVSIEKGGHGVFTSLLLDALAGGAADVQGHITPGSIYAYIDQALGAWHKQRPVFKTNVAKFTVLKKITPSVSHDILRNLITYFPTAESEFDLDPSFEKTNSPDEKHEILEPYAKAENVAVFKELQRMESVGLLVPVGADHMYFAAMESKACRLTALGFHYWRLVKEEHI